MKKINQTDLHRIAAKITTAGFGVFPTTSLVNYGATVMVKPGAVTDQNVVLSGHDIAEILAGAYTVFPVAIEYAPLHSFESLGAVASEMKSLDGDLDRLGDGFGALYGDVSARLRRRYERIAQRYRKVATKSIAKGKGTDTRRLRRLSKRLEKIWSKMKTKGVKTEGLSSPKTVRKAISRGVARADEELTRKKRDPTLDATQTRSKVKSDFDVPVPVDRQMNEDDIPDNDEDLLADDDELGSDIRAETVGYLFSGAEHDYYGVEGTPAEIILSDDEDVSVEDPGGEEVEELEEGAAEADAELRAADQDLVAEGEEFDLDDELEAAEAADARPQAEAAAKVSPLTKAQAKKAAQTRANISKGMAEVQKKIDEGKGDTAHADLAKVLRDQADLLAYVDKRLKTGSTNGGVVYGRIRPARRGRYRRAPRALVIGIRKRSQPNNALRMQRYATDAGLEPTGSPVDVFAADMTRVSQGYTALDSLTAIRDSTNPVDYVQGSSANALAGMWVDEEDNP